MEQVPFVPINSNKRDGSSKKWPSLRNEGATLTKSSGESKEVGVADDKRKSEKARKRESVGIFVSKVEAVCLGACIEKEGGVFQKTKVCRERMRRIGNERKMCIRSE